MDTVEPPLLNRPPRIGLRREGTESTRRKPWIVSIPALDAGTMPDCFRLPDCFVRSPAQNRPHQSLSFLQSAAVCGCFIMGAIVHFLGRTITDS